MWSMTKSNFQIIHIQWKLAMKLSKLRYPPATSIFKRKSFSLRNCQKEKWKSLILQSWKTFNLKSKILSLKARKRPLIQVKLPQSNYFKARLPSEKCKKSMVSKNKWKNTFMKTMRNNTSKNQISILLIIPTTMLLRLWTRSRLDLSRTFLAQTLTYKATRVRTCFGWKTNHKIW